MHDESECRAEEPKEEPSQTETRKATYFVKICVISSADMAESKVAQTVDIW
jgi:hypothetical protein